MIEEEHDEGWGFPLTGRKWHYFTEPISLCRKWMYTGSLKPDIGSIRSNEDCVICTRKLDKIKP